MPSPTVHYLWVGPKPEGKNAGQDTVGPDLLRQKYPTADQPIVFWCLDTEVDYYKDYFANSHPDKAPIEVKGIESYVQKHSEEKYDPDKDAFYNLIREMCARASAFPEAQDKIREWITIKEAFSYFLQCCEEGYIADSNVMPSEECIEPIPALESFHVPFVPNEVYVSRPDPWLMFCKKGDPKSAERFHFYLSELKKWFAYCEKENTPMEKTLITDIFPGPPPTARLLLNTLFTMTPIKLVKEETDLPGDIDNYYPEDGATNNDFIVTEIGFYKRYHNTHRDTHIHELPLLHRILIGHRSLHELAYFLEKQKMDPFQPYPLSRVSFYGDSETTLVNEALKYAKYPELGILLAYSKDPHVFITLRRSNANSVCLDRYFESKAKILNMSEDELFIQLEQILLLTNTIYPPRSSTVHPKEMRELITLMKGEDAISAHKCLELFVSLGPINSQEDVKKYVNQLKIWDKGEKRPPSPTHFKPEASSAFHEDEAQRCLSKMVSHHKVKISLGNK